MFNKIRIRKQNSLGSIRLKWYLRNVSLLSKNYLSEPVKLEWKKVLTVLDGLLLVLRLMLLALISIDLLFFIFASLKKIINFIETNILVYHKSLQGECLYLVDLNSKVVCFLRSKRVEISIVICFRLYQMQIFYFFPNINSIPSHKVHNGLLIN